MKIIPESLAEEYNWLLDNIDEEKPLLWSVSKVGCFLGLQLGDRQFSPSSFAINFPTHIRRIVYVPGLRGNPGRTYNTAAVGSEFPGFFENYVASIVNYWQETKDERLIKLG